MQKVFKLSQDIIYGPVKSRRLGTSLGVNILPFGIKVCSFNCIYCQCGWTRVSVEEAYEKYRFPSVSEIESALKQCLVKLKWTKIDFITLSGNGEPTMHLDFFLIVKAIKKIAGNIKVTILSNAAHLDNPGVIEGLNLLDERIMKLDVGDQEYFEKLNLPLVNISIEKIIEGLKKLKDMIVQSMFVRGSVDNTTEENIQKWLMVIKEIKPRMVQIYSIDRVPADSGIYQADSKTLTKIAKRLKKETGINALVV